MPMRPWLRLPKSIEPGDLKIRHRIDSRQASRWFRWFLGGSNGLRFDSGVLRVF